jgi:hypothetical protein
MRPRGAAPEWRLLAIFDVFDDWFRRDDFEACSVASAPTGMGASHPLGQAGIEYLQHIRQVVTTLAEGARLRDPPGFACSWHVLMTGSIMSATEGDADAAQRAKSMARALIWDHSDFSPVVPERPGLNAQHDPAPAQWSDWDELLGQRAAPEPLSPEQLWPANFGDDDCAFDLEYDLG